MRAPLLLLVGAIAAAIQVAAQEPFAYGSRMVADGENGTFEVIEVEFLQQRLQFVLPRRWQPTAVSEPNTIKLEHDSRAATLTIQFSPAEAQTLLQQPATLPAIAAAWAENAVVRETFPVVSGYTNGVGLELSFDVAGSLMKGHLALIPLRRGYVTFFLAATADSWSSHQGTFGSTITSFQPAVESTRSGTHVPAELLASRVPKTEPKLPATTAPRLPPAPYVPPPVEPGGEPPKEWPSLIEGREEQVVLIFSFGLVVVLVVRVLMRHREEAEIRALSGGYLSDGTEVAKFKLPDWFSPGPETSPSSEVAGAEAESDDRREMPEPLQRFFREVPAEIAQMREAVQKLVGVTDVPHRQSGLIELLELVAALKNRANCWELRPAWQLSSALELLVKRAADKPKDVTPSVVHSIASAVDLLRDICVPGIRSNLIMEPPLRILAADDDPLCGRAVMFALQKANLTPEIVQSGEDAVTLAKAHAYDVVFMDIIMPGMGGVEACAAIHEVPHNRDVPVVFVTGHSDFHNRTQSRVKGGADVIAKPYLVFELTVKALEYAMRKRLRGLPAPAAAPAPEVAPTDSAPATDSSGSLLAA
jgi:CheY-like chemotaxis protein